MDASREQLIEYANLFHPRRTQFFRARRQNRARFQVSPHTHIMPGACDTSISPNCFSPPPVDVTVAPLPVSLFEGGARFSLMPQIGLRLCVVYSSTNSTPLHLISYFIRTFWGSNASSARSDSLCALVKWSDPVYATASMAIFHVHMHEAASHLDRPTRATLFFQNKSTRLCALPGSGMIIYFVCFWGAIDWDATLFF